MGCSVPLAYPFGVSFLPPFHHLLTVSLGILHTFIVIILAKISGPLTLFSSKEKSWFSFKYAPVTIALWLSRYLSLYPQTLLWWFEWEWPPQGFLCMNTWWDSGKDKFLSWAVSSEIPVCSSHKSLICSAVAKNPPPEGLERVWEAPHYDTNLSHPVRSSHRT